MFTEINRRRFVRTAVYYWLVRSRHEDDYPVLCEFLVRFQEERRRNCELSVANSKSGAIDRKLLNYDRYNRSTNDQQSHLGRFEILTAKLEYFRSVSRRPKKKKEPK